MKILNLDLIASMHEVMNEKENSPRPVGGMGTMAIDNIEMSPADFNRKYGTNNPAQSIMTAPKQKGAGSIEGGWGNPWARNEDKVFIDLKNGRVSGARQATLSSPKLKIAGDDYELTQFTNPLERGGMGATQTQNTSQKVVWMPAKLFDIHVNMRRL